MQQSSNTVRSGVTNGRSKNECHEIEKNFTILSNIKIQQYLNCTFRARRKFKAVGTWLIS